MNVEAAELDRRLAHFKALAARAGVKLTHQRLEIFREVARSLEHPDAEAVHRAVRKRMPTVSLDTVYRTLWLLSDLGLVSTLGPRRESVRFDANLAPHHHFICMRCGMARDFTSVELNSLRIPDAVRDLGSIVGTRVEVRGVCSGCARKQAKDQGTKNPSLRNPKERSKP